MTYTTLSRRRFLGSALAAGGASLVLGAGGRARAQSCGAGPLLICVEAQNAWDPTFLMDPKTDPAFTPFVAADLRTALGTSIVYAPRPFADGSKVPYQTGGQDFFEKHGSKLLVINGLDHATVSHDVGPRVAFTGGNREGVPSLTGLLAMARGQELPLALLMTDGFVDTVGLAPITPAPRIETLLGLARSNVPNASVAESARTYHPSGAWALLRERTRARAERRRLAESLPRAVAAALQVEQANNTGVSAAFDGLADEFLAAAGVDTDNVVIPRAAACLAAMEAGACVAAHISTGESFDTHTGHDADHPVSMQELLEIVDFIIDRVAASPVLTARGVLLHVASDFGRTKYNPDGGKDHWPISSTMIAGLGAAAGLVEGGRVVGGTTIGGGTGTLAMKVKSSDGDVVTTADDDPDGFTLTPGHVQLALREALGFCPDVPGDLAGRFKLPNVYPSAPLPLLKRV